MDKLEYQSAVSTLNVWAYNYYALDNPVATDEEYDALYRRVRSYEDAHADLIDPNSPTQRVGDGMLDGFEKRSHGVPMLSLRDAFGEDEIRKWIELLEKEHGKQLFICEPKFDGASLNLVYRDGKLTHAITRGNGKEGEDVTAAAGVIRGIPMSIEGTGLPPRCEIRGEVMMAYRQFEKNNIDRVAAGKEPFANPRNAASGTLRQLDLSEIGNRGLIFMPYDLKEHHALLGSQSEVAELLNSDLFIPTPKRAVCRNADEVIDAFNAFTQMRGSLPFGIDGMVIKVNSREMQERIGSARKHPKWALAAKMPAVEAVTKLLDVVPQVGKHGVSPVAVLEPVLVDGSTVSRATLHNYAEIEAMGLMIGDTVTVFKAGDIIPAIGGCFPARRDGSEREIVAPIHCPSCGTHLVKNSKKDGSEGASLLCPNDRCDAKIQRYLEYIGGRDILDIDGLGKTAAQKLVDALDVVDVFDLLNLTVDQIASLEGYGRKSAEKFHAAIRGIVGRVTLDKIIILLQSPDIGRSISKTLVDALGEDALNPDAVENFTLHGTSDDVFKAYAALLREKHLIVGLMLEKIKPVMPASEQKPESKGGSLSGLKIVITGKLPKPRSFFAGLIEENGGAFSDRITKDVDYLVTGDAVGASKLSKAAKLGIEVMEAEAFFAEYGIAV